MDQPFRKTNRRNRKVRPGDERENTTIYIKLSIQEQARDYAYEDGRSFGGLVEKALVAYMANHPLNQPEPATAN